MDTLRWREEVFKISKIQLAIQVTYKITDYNGEESTFRIEKELNIQGDKSLVKWMGYPKSFHSWIDTKAMVKLTTWKSF